MAWLERPGTSQRVTLPTRCLMGRGPQCVLKTSDRRVSSEHARISWTGQRWEVRDLGSRNGTFVNGERLDPGVGRPLVPGDQLGLGGPEHGWTLADAGPPVALARALTGDTLSNADAGMVVIPSPEDPQACVFEHLQHGWVIELDGELRPVHDCEVVTVAERAWMLHLPLALDETADAGGDVPMLAAIELSFEVSLDEEHVAVTMHHGTREQPLGDRSHHHLLLLLARARLEDEAAAQTPSSEHGWRYADDVCQMLQLESLRLNTEIYRARKELAQQGVQGAAGLVERRRASKSIRLGVRARVAPR